MSRIDRYLLLQMLGPFGFFTLALAGILWLAQTLPLVEIIIDNGQSGIIFAEFSALILPSVLIIVMPLSALAAALFSTNRLMTESEMPVVMAAGLSPFRIARATLVMGLIVMLSMYVLVIYLQPIATTRLGDRVLDLKQDAISILLKEKQFIHPINGITIYIRDASEKGEMDGLFLHDQRDPKIPTTYSARQALLLKENSELRLIMFDGTIQIFSDKEETLNIIEFEKFVFDMTALVATNNARNRLPLEYFISELINPDKIIAAGGTRSYGAYLAVGHQKIALPLLGLTLPFLATVMLLSASFRRSSYIIPIATASSLGVFFLTLTLLVQTWVASNPHLFIVSYAPPVFCLAVTSAILLWPKRSQKKRIKHGVTA